MPPTGRTCPDSVISPVRAQSPRTTRPVSAETSAATIATPAEAPSLRAARDCTCTWMSAPRWKRGSIPYRAALARTHDSATRADSCITSPSPPVRLSAPVPGMRLTSTVAAEHRGKRQPKSDARPAGAGGDIRLAM